MSKLWLDEERPPPNKTWTACRTVAQAKNFLIRYNPGVTEASLDHDIEPGSIVWLKPSGLSFVRWMIRENLVPPLVTVHSQNPIGGFRMVLALRRAGARVRWRPYGLL